MEKVSGIYIIINTISNGVYIGQSHNLHNRWLAHKSKLRVQKHPCRHLQSSWNKYGGEAFIFEILEVSRGNKEQLTEAEQYWIDYCKFIGARIYNSAPSAGSNRGFKQSENEIGRASCRERVCLYV